MDPYTNAAHVEYRQSELNELASSLRRERSQTRPGWRHAARVALGRRLVLAGIALLDGDRRRAAAPHRAVAPH